jgi:1-acyl-sn-glycerol-3-phosphate acyltransferase
VPPPSSSEPKPGDPERFEDPYLQGILHVLRALALECGGARALAAVTPTASLVRDVGLGSLEQVELGLRLEETFGVQLGEEALGADTAVELARAVREAHAAQPLPRPSEGVLPPAAPVRVTQAGMLHEALRNRAEAEASRPHVYLREDDGSFRALTYGQLWEGAAAVAGGIVERGVGKGQTVALMLPTGADFLSTFMGIVLAGAVPVPLYPPGRAGRLEDYLRRQAGILGNAEARLLVTEPRATPVARVLGGTLGYDLALTSADELASGEERMTSVSGSQEDAAVIQYTSGSTGAPKGVLLSHRAVIANIRALAAHVEVTPADVVVSWLPLYHDMGLIGTWLNSLYHGVPLVLMSPLAFLGRPDRWLWTIHRYRATVSAAPNFGYELCTRKVPDERLEGLDLSSWRCALNGSEPVSASTVERFSRRFAPHGFRSEALMPAYGLAESSVGLCLTPLGRRPVVDCVSRSSFEREGSAEPAPPGDSSALSFVSVGRPLAGHEVRVVDDRGEPLPERHVGRLIFRGPSTMDGYYRRPDATQEIALPGGWMDSGDLAYLKGGETYVTGRRKDLVIKAGRKLVPEDIEAVVGAVEGIREGCVAVFGVADPQAGTERLVVVAETRLTDPQEVRSLESAVIRRVSDALDLPPDRVLLLPPGSVPKTSSGKLRRSAAREWFLAGRLGRPERPSFRMQVEFLRSRAARAVSSVWKRTRRLAYLAYLLAAAPAAALLLGPVWGLVSILRERRPALVLERWMSRIALRVVCARVAVEGMENVPERGPLIIAVNHASYADIPVLLGHLPIDLRMVAKSEVLAWPFIGTLVRKGGHPTVDRWDFRKSVGDAREIESRLAAGETILFFPEGTFVRGAGLRPFRAGAFETAVETGTPVIPVALKGTRQMLPLGKTFPRPGLVHIWIGVAQSPEGKGWPAVIGLRDRVFEAILAHCGEPRLEMVAGGPGRPARAS